jgi:hypothetical protein
VITHRSASAAQCRHPIRSSTPQTCCLSRVQHLLPSERRPCSAAAKCFLGEPEFEPKQAPSILMFIPYLNTIDIFDIRLVCKQMGRKSLITFKKTFVLSKLLLLFAFTREHLRRRFKSQSAFARFVCDLSDVHAIIWCLAIGCNLPKSTPKLHTSLS